MIPLFALPGTDNLCIQGEIRAEWPRACRERPPHAGFKGPDAEWKQVCVVLSGAQGGPEWTEEGRRDSRRLVCVCVCGRQCTWSHVSAVMEEQTVAPMRAKLSSAREGTKQHNSHPRALQTHSTTFSPLCLHSFQMLLEAISLQRCCRLVFLFIFQ